MRLDGLHKLAREEREGSWNFTQGMFESWAGDVMTLPYITVFEYAISNQK